VPTASLTCPPTSLPPPRHFSTPPPYVVGPGQVQPNRPQGPLQGVGANLGQTAEVGGGNDSVFVFAHFFLHDKGSELVKINRATGPLARGVQV